MMNDHTPSENVSSENVVTTNAELKHDETVKSDADMQAEDTVKVPKVVAPVHEPARVEYYANPEIYQALPAYPTVPYVAPQLTPKQPSGLAKPLPIWLVVGGVVALIVVIGLISISNASWATGTAYAALFAAVVTVLLLGFLGVRAAFGLVDKTNPRRKLQLISSLLLIFVLTAYSGIGLALQPVLHTNQAHYLKAQQQWESAVHYYKLSGQKAPSSQYLASTYLDWGKNLYKKEQYAEATEKFETVINDFTDVKEEVKEAKKAQINTYIYWSKQLIQKKDYTAALNHLNTVVKNPYCYIECAGTVKELNITVRYEQSLELAQSKKFADALVLLREINNRSTSSQVNTKIHTQLSKVLLGRGEQQMANSCISATPIYEELAKDFADLPEGKKAQKALDPNNTHAIKGRITIDQKIKGYPIYAALVPNLVKEPEGDLIFDLVDQSPMVQVKEDGSFELNEMKPGEYTLIIKVVRPDVISYLWYYSKSTQEFVHRAKVTPLCPFTFHIEDNEFGKSAS